VKTRAAVLVLGVAGTVGSLVGAFVLPDRGTDPGSRASTSASPAVSVSTTPSVTKSAAPPTPRVSPTRSVSPPSGDLGDGPVTTANLLTDADLRKVGLKLTPTPVTGSRLELVSCNRARETLDSVAESGPPVQQGWEDDPAEDDDPNGGVAVYQQVIANGTEEEAQSTVRFVLNVLEECQRAKPGTGVYGPTHSEILGPGTTATWLGKVDGTLNKTGRAPKGEKIRGGVAVVRRGQHVAVFTISWCAGAGEYDPCASTGGVAGPGAYGQLVALSRAAARRLG
jgi:hypothetical protein